jgi:YD repeat-containing protein
MRKARTDADGFCDRKDAPAAYTPPTNIITTTRASPITITSIERALGIPIARNEYSDDGRLTAMIDANGNRTEFIHDLTNSVERVIDRLGFTNSVGYDSRGNVIATTNAIGGVTLSAFDDLNNTLSAQPSRAPSHRFRSPVFRHELFECFPQRQDSAQFAPAAARIRGSQPPLKSQSTNNRKLFFVDYQRLTQIALNFFQPPAVIFLMTPSDISIVSA